MRFIDIRRVAERLTERFPIIDRQDVDLSSSLCFAAQNARYTVIGPSSACLGSDAYRHVYVRIETDGPKSDAELDNERNLRSPYVVTSTGSCTTKHYPVAAADIDSEGDLLPILASAIEPDEASFNVFRAPTAPVRAFVERIAGGPLTSLSAAVASSTVDELGAVASHDEDGVGGGAYFLSAIVPESWVEAVAIYERRNDFRYENYYELAFDFLLDEIAAEARELPFKLRFASQWNVEYALTYSRLRACIVANRLVFVMPICLGRRSGGSGESELVALRQAAAAYFEMRSVRFIPPPSDKIYLAVVEKVAKYAVTFAVKNLLGI